MNPAPKTYYVYLLASIAASYNVEGQITSVTDPAGDTVRFGYDDLRHGQHPVGQSGLYLRCRRPRHQEVGESGGDRDAVRGQWQHLQRCK